MPSSEKTPVLIRKVQVVLHIRNISAPNLMQDARLYIDGIARNKKWFPSPIPSLQEIRSQVNALDLACVNAASGTRAAVEAKRIAQRALKNNVLYLANYVESVANAHPDHAAEIVLLSNMHIKNSNRSYKQDFTVTPGKNKGELILTVRKATKRETYRFEISTNPDIPSYWHIIQQNTKSKATARYLTEGILYYARVFRTDKTGTRQIGQVISRVLA
jgi:hypothetical protein